MDAILDYGLELQFYWKAISFLGILLMAERAALWRSPRYKAWAHQRNRGWLIRLGIALVAVAVFGFLAFEGERRKNISNMAVVVGQPGTVFNVDGGGSAIVAYLTLKSSGQTLAGSTRWEVGVNILDAIAGEGSFEGLGEPQLREGPIVISPGESITRNPEIGCPPDAGERAKMAEDFEARKKGIFVFGRITYNTLGEIWFSTFCRIYMGGNTYIYRDPEGFTVPPEAYPAQEYVPYSNPSLNHIPRKAFD